MNLLNSQMDVGVSVSQNSLETPGEFNLDQTGRLGGTAAGPERKQMEHLLSNREDMHTLSVYVANKPGVLARIAQVFARRGYNIDSLVVSSSRDGRFSRMTVTAKGDPEGLDQIIAQVNKLVDVVRCVDHTGENAVVRELALMKVSATAEERTGVLQIAEHFKCKTVDLTENSIILMATGDTEKVDAMIKMMSKHRIIELVRTGKVVMARGNEET
jgi:acetolactate synthase I/III small subunit